MPLSLKYLPTSQFEERHEILVNGQPSAILDAVQGFDPTEDRLISVLLGLRQLPHKIIGRKADARESFGLKDFTLLERSDHQMAFGLVGRFWRLDFGLEQIADGRAFTAFSRPGVAKLVMSFNTDRIDEGHTRLSTQTRIFCPDRSTHLLIAAYWTIIRIASGVIRQRMLRQVKTRVEATH